MFYNKSGWRSKGSTLELVVEKILKKKENIFTHVDVSYV